MVECQRAQQIYGSTILNAGPSDGSKHHLTWIQGRLAFGHTLSCVLIRINSLYSIVLTNSQKNLHSWQNNEIQIRDIYDNICINSAYEIQQKRQTQNSEFYNCVCVSTEKRNQASVWRHFQHNLFKKRFYLRLQEMIICPLFVLSLLRDVVQ